MIPDYLDAVRVRELQARSVNGNLANRKHTPDECDILPSHPTIPGLMPFHNLPCPGCHVEAKVIREHGHGRGCYFGGER